MTLERAEKAILTEFCYAEFNRQLDGIRERWDLSEEDFGPTLQLNHRWNAPSSWAWYTGGKLVMSITTYHVIESLRNKEKIDYEEYVYIANKRGIGNLKNVGWKNYIRCLIAHEFAHLLMEKKCTIDALRPDFPIHVTQDRRVHGLLWQEIYRKLRSAALKSKR